MDTSQLKFVRFAGILLMLVTIALPAPMAGQEKQLLIRLKNGQTITYGLDEIESLQFVSAAASLAAGEISVRDTSPAKAGQPANPATERPLGPLRLLAGSLSFSGATGPANLFDGNGGTGWSSRPDARFPHEFLVEFQLTHMIGAVEFDNATQEGTYPGASARDVTLLASNGSPNGPWITVATLTLARGANQQRFTIAPVTARWIRMMVRTNYGHPNYTQLMDVRFYPAGENRRTP